MPFRDIFIEKEMAMDMNEHQIEAFWSKVDIRNTVKDCWVWNGAKTPKGYGNVRINKKYLKSHRVAFSIANGEIPEGYIVCHICDNPSCCNPSHLMLGTIKSNAADMILKSRGKKPESAARGSVNGRSKLNEENVRQIRRLYASGEMNQYEIAKMYGVSQPAIGSILRGKTWRHV